VHLVITDSGLGGLSICAELARRAAAPEAGSPLRLTYVNAWPEEGRGYNDLPDMAARAAGFDRALARVAALAPDRILIACNTLSIVYPATVFSRSAPLPVQGIVDTGVALFAAALAAEPSASIVLLGTRTTIDSRVHHDRLVALGIDARRVSGVSCHGLATAIERDIDGPAVDELIAKCAADARAAAPIGALVLLGLCCTHYGYVADLARAAAPRASAGSEPADGGRYRMGGTGRTRCGGGGSGRRGAGLQPRECSESRIDFRDLEGDAR
jgi:glutamate racemase